MLPGFMPPLGAWLGAGSFDDGAVGRFAVLRDSGSRIGDEFTGAWRRMRAEVDAVLDDDIGGPLSSTFAEAGTVDGAITPKMQRELTRQRESTQVQITKALVTALPGVSRQRAAFVASDRLSRAFLLAPPTHEVPILTTPSSRRSWRRNSARQPRHARCLWAVRSRGRLENRLDEDGAVFFTDTHLLNRGGARTVWHDTIEALEFEALREGHAPVAKADSPYGFKSHKY